MVQPTNGPRRFSEGFIAPHPSLRFDAVDVAQFVSERQVYTREYLNSVTPLHRQPQAWYQMVAWIWHLAARTFFSILTLSWLSGIMPTESSMIARLLSFSSVGVAGGAAGAAWMHVRSVLFNLPDNAWAHTMIRGAENCRMHGGIIAMAVHPNLLGRLMGVILQSVLFFQLYIIQALFPSVANAYGAYRAEEQVATTTRLIEMIDAGKATRLAGTKVPMMAQSYYGLSSASTMREVLLRIRADEAANAHICHVLAEQLPGSKNPFVVSADIKLA